MFACVCVSVYTIVMNPCGRYALYFVRAKENDDTRVCHSS